MITSHYNIDHYIEPHTTYKTLYNKIKLGHLIFNSPKKSFEVVDLKILETIVAFENGNDLERVYYPISLSPKWLTNVFSFDVTYLSIYHMNVFTSKIHGLKIHEQHNRYYVGYTIREKVSLVNGMKGTISNKPQILYVHELMDQLFLIKREEISITASDLVDINNSCA